MELIQFTSENIASYLADCAALQAQLKPGKDVDDTLLTRTAAEPANYFTGVKIDGRIAGMGLLSTLVHTTNTTGYVNSIVVDETARGKGLFSVIMDALENEASRRGCGEVVLTCSREHAQHLYERRGYTAKDTKFYKRAL